MQPWDGCSWASTISLVAIVLINGIILIPATCLTIVFAGLADASINVSYLAAHPLVGVVSIIAVLFRHKSTSAYLMRCAAFVGNIVLIVISYLSWRFADAGEGW